MVGWLVGWVGWLVNAELSPKRYRQGTELPGAEGPRVDSVSALLSLQKGCGLWTHCLATLFLTVNETVKWLSSLPVLKMQESFWW